MTGCEGICLGTRIPAKSHPPPVRLGRLITVNNLFHVKEILVPRRSQHVRVGAVTGTAAAAVAAGASGQGPVATTIEAAGGAIGGWAGARLPDFVNPPTSPCHRAFAHSTCAGSGIVAAMAATILNWQTSCRERAAACHEAWNRPDATLLDTVFAALGEIFWRLVAGFLAGVPVGYASHLAMDSLTSAGIRFA